MHISVVLLLLFTFPVFAADDSITLIANESVPVNSPLTKHALRDIYLLKKERWPDANRIIFVNRKSNTPIRNTLEKIMGINSQEYVLYLKKMHYKGKALPLIQDSRQAVLIFVNKVPGSFAYVRGDVSDEYESVKVIGLIK